MVRKSKSEYAILKKGKKEYRNKYWYEKKYNAIDLATKALKQVAYIRGMINCEKKFNDQSNILMNKPCSTLGSMTLLTAMAQGDGDFQRNGNSVLLKSLLLRVRLSANSNASAPINQSIRMIIFQDRNVSNTTPVISDIIESGNVGTERAVLSPLSTKLNGRVKIIRDKLFRLVKDQDSNERIYKDYIKVHTHLKYIGTGATQADVSGGHFYMILFGDNDTYQPEFDGMIRIAYYDN